jgi:hypothetical protein
MRHVMIALGAVLVLSLMAASPASADYGTYTTSNGLSCNYSGFGSMYTINCSGISMPSGRFVNYSCSYFIYGPNSASWDCRDINGNTWHGSR